MIRRNFTLVEILTVIAIIAILMGLLLPVMSTAQRKGKENKARAAIQSIKFAIEQYENDYGLLPRVNGTSDADTYYNAHPTSTESKLEDSNAPNTDYDKLMEILTFTKSDKTKGGEALIKDSSDTYLVANLKKIRYIEAPANLVTDVSENKGYYILDPWGRRYGIIIDNDYSGQVAFKKYEKPNDSSGKSMNTVTVRSKVAVFSYGAQKDGIKKADDDPTYHITSWK